MIFPNIKPTSQKRLLQLKRNTGGEKYVSWREYVLKRDGYRCQAGICNSEERLQVHHIFTYAKYPHLRYITLNGITLCELCHRKTFGKEELFAIAYSKRASLNDELFDKKY